MNKIHKKIEEVLKYPKHGTVLDGVFCSEAIDTSGESIDIKEMDITSLNDGSGIANTEHINPEDKEVKNAEKDAEGHWSVIVGRIIFAKKIFSEKDCETDRELDFWKELELPFVYGAVELFDSENHRNAEDLAAMVRHYHSRGLPVVARYSIEGSTVSRDGNVLKHTIARRVAITIKPCSHAAVSSLVSESAHSHKKMEKTEKYVGGAFETECYPLVFENDPVQDLIKGLGVLKKTLSLGSGMAAPSSLTQGAALQSEELIGKARKDKLLKAQILAALRDWSPFTDLEKHLTHYLKDVDPAFISKFSEMAKDVVFTKKELTMSLNKTENEPKEVDYMGKKVIPGEAQIIAGPFAGSKLKLLHLDDNHAHVEAFKSGGQESAPINKIPRKHEGINWMVMTPPKVADRKILVDNKKHGDRKINRNLSQNLLIDGINLNDPKYKKMTNSLTSDSIDKDDHFGWFHNKLGNKVLVKPEIQSEYDKVKNYPSSKREVLFKNLADEYFDLGDFVPQTASFTHPESKKSYSAMEMVPEAEHFTKTARPIKFLKQLGHSGHLDKLAVMDSVLGNSDRASHLNYMFSSNAPHMHLIDNASVFNFNDLRFPGYMHDVGHSDPLFLEQHMHPEAVKWALDLDPFQLKHLMDQHEVPEEHSSESIKRLLSIQSALLLGNKKRKDVLLAHHKLTNPVQPNEEDQGDF